jgi:hypothetical protein
MNKTNIPTREEEILFRAEKMLLYKNLLIDQCNGWLSEEEGFENMKKRFKKKEKGKK